MSWGGGINEYQKLINREKIWQTWNKFVKGKWRQKAVREFWLHLEANLDKLYHELEEGAYSHGPYYHFVAQDTKRRDIYVAAVRDRIVHQLVADYLEKIYAPRFYTYSCAAQKGKGLALARKYILTTIKSLQNHHQVWIAKLDVKKYFASVNHHSLLEFLRRRIKNQQVLWLCRQIIEGFGNNGRGLPLGNLTSQWFANIYLHELDWQAKQVWRVKYYARYNDDVIIIETSRQKLEQYVKLIRQFVSQKLLLEIPESKTQIVCLPQVVDILGLCTNGNDAWLRPVTKKRIAKRLIEKQAELSVDLLDSLCAYANTSRSWRGVF